MPKAISSEWRAPARADQSAPERHQGNVKRITQAGLMALEMIPSPATRVLVGPIGHGGAVLWKTIQNTMTIR